MTGEGTKSIREALESEEKLRPNEEEPSPTASFPAEQDKECKPSGE